MSLHTIQANSVQPQNKNMHIALLLCNINYANKHSVILAPVIHYDWSQNLPLLYLMCDVDIEAYTAWFHISALVCYACYATAKMLIWVHSILFAQSEVTYTLTCGTPIHFPGHPTGPHTTRCRAATGQREI